MNLPEALIKICSLRQPQQAEFAVAAGADAVGLIFADARRQVTVERAREIVAELRRLEQDGPVLVFGVFLNQPLIEVNHVADRVELDVVQLHGHESLELISGVERPVVKVVRPGSGGSGPDLPALQALPRPPVAYMMDGASATGAGGTGERADWVTATEVATRARLVLAGGLTPQNVGVAVQQVRPLGVDVGSGVETDGVKDRDKVLAFVAAARAAFDRLVEEAPGSVSADTPAAPSSLRH